MINDTTPSIVLVTAEVAKARINLALTGAEMSIQAMQTKVDTLVYNEDNLPAIKETVLAVGYIVKKIEEAFESGKKPFLEGGRAWDAAKRDLMALISPISTKVTQQHTVLCQAVEKRNRDNAAAEKRKKDIQDKITATILGFSQEITACTNSIMLQTIQNRINAEQGRKNTYFEFLPDLIERCAGLNQPLKDQKEAIRQLEGLNAVEEIAIATGDDQTLLEIQDKKDEIQGKIQENKIRTEESAINSSTRGYGNNGVTQTFPTVKPARRIWKYEVKDIETLYKKCPGLVNLTPNDEKIKEILKEKMTEGETKDKESIDFMGLILFYVDKKW